MVNFVKPCNVLPLCYFNIYVLQVATSHGCRANETRSKWTRSIFATCSLANTLTTCATLAVSLLIVVYYSQVIIICSFAFL